MPNNSNTLNIGSLRLKKDYPVAQTEALRAEDQVNHPAAAAAARAKIAALPEHNPLEDPAKVPATPTAELILDRQMLAHQAGSGTAADVTNRKLPSAVKPMLTAIGIFAITLLLFKAPVILSQLGYTFSGKNTPAASPAPAVGSVIPAESTITIPKINVHAPIIYEPSVVEANVQKALESGVVHYGNTASPGQAGNSAIFGHSSNDWWEPGNYKFVFVLLDKLSPGDKLTLDYQSKRYTYEVTGSKIVEPTDISVLNPTAQPTITLITCTPPGTSLRRLVVTAKQIDPSPSQATVATATANDGNSSSSLPSAAPSFLTQLDQAWDGIIHGFKSLFGSDSPDKPTEATPSGQIPAAK